MILTGVYNIASGEHSGFAAEQVISNHTGFYAMGRRTDAAAWTIEGVDEVIRISRDAKGSQAYFGLAKNHQQNPYMPVVYKHTVLPSHDHIAHIEKLESPAIQKSYAKFKALRSSLDAGDTVSESDVQWFEEMKYTAMMTKVISDFLSFKSAHLDMNSLPESDAFREAIFSLVDLTRNMYLEDRRFVPIPDMNKTNILWRRTTNGLVPVLYDAVTSNNLGKEEDIDFAHHLRDKLGMAPAIYPA